MICSIVIATNNVFGLKDRARAYLRRRLEVPTELEQLRSRHLASDRDLFGQIREMLPSEKPMSYVRDTDFAGAFPSDLTKGMHHFTWECRKPEFEFHDTELEAARAKLEEKTHAFLDPVGQNTFVVEGNAKFVQVPKDWRHRHPDKYSEAVRQINMAADELYKTYDAFIRLGRKKLGDSDTAV